MTVILLRGPVDIITRRRASEETQFQLGLFAHHLFAPGRIKGELHMAVDHPFDLFHPLLDIMDDITGCRAGGSGQGHRDLDIAIIFHMDIIDQAQVENIDGDLRIEDRAESSFYLIAH